jgi:S1-C subfamily serine protease
MLTTRHVNNPPSTMSGVLKPLSWAALPLAALAMVLMQHTGMITPAESAHSQGGRSKVKSQTATPRTPILPLRDTDDRPRRVAEDDLGEVERAALEATVCVINAKASRYGSGVIVASGAPLSYILTAAHVTDGAQWLEVQSFAQARPSITSRAAEVVARAPDTDLALLRMETQDALLCAIPISPPGSIPPASGSVVISVGCDGVGGPSVLAAHLTGKRLVQKLHETPAVVVWQVNHRPKKGHSGGPLIDARGYLIGIASGSNGEEAYYCCTDDIHQFLRQCGMKWLYETARNR